MKKLVSIVTLVAMLASVFTMTASAASSDVWETKTYNTAAEGTTIAEQDFENVAENTALTTIADSLGSVEVVTDSGNSYAKFKADADGNFRSWLVTGADMTDSDWTIEFDLKNNVQGSGVEIAWYAKDAGTNTHKKGVLRLRSHADGAGSWYRYRISQTVVYDPDNYNMGTATITCYRKDLSDSAADWTLYADSNGFNCWVGGNAWAVDGKVTEYGALSFEFCNDAWMIPTEATAANTEWLIDNVRLYKSGVFSASSKGTVLAEQNYEDTANNKAATEAEFVSSKKGSIELVTESGNTYAKFKAAEDGSFRTYLASGLDMNVTDWTLEFDLKCETQGAALGWTYWAKDAGTNSSNKGGANMRSWADGFDTWKRYRVTLTNTSPTVVDERKDLSTANAAWAPFDSTSVTSYWNHTWATFGSSSVGNNPPAYGAVMFAFQPATWTLPTEFSGNVADTVWCIDNIVLYNNETATVTGTDENGEINATVTYTDNDAIAANTQMTALVAVYSDGKLVDAQLGSGAYNDGLTVSDIALDAATFDEAKLFVWDANNAPVMSKALDLTPSFN